MKSILRSGSIYALANIMSSAVPFFLLPVLTRVLSPDDFGKVIAFFMVAAIAGSTAGMGLHGSIYMRWVSDNKKNLDRFTGTAIILVLLSTVSTMILAVIVVPMIGIHIHPALAFIAPIIPGAYSIQTMRFTVWQCQQKPLPAAYLQVSSSMLNASCSLLCVLLLGFGGEGRILGATIAGILMMSVSVYFLKTSGEAKLCFDKKESRFLLKFGLPLIPHALAGAFLGNIDRMAVSSKLDMTTLGIYGAAAQLGMVLNVLADACTKAYLPYLYRTISKKTTRCRLRVVGITYLSIPVWAALTMVLWFGFKYFGGHLLGPKYSQANSLAIWFFIASAFGAVYHNVAAIFFSNNRTDQLSLATMFTALVSAAVSIPLVVNYGIIGGALITIVTQACMLITSWIISMRVEMMPWSHPVLALRVLFNTNKSVKIY